MSNQTIIFVLLGLLLIFVLAAYLTPFRSILKKGDFGNIPSAILAAIVLPLGFYIIRLREGPEPEWFDLYTGLALAAIVIPWTWFLYFTGSFKRKKQTGAF